MTESSNILKIPQQCLLWQIFKKNLIYVVGFHIVLIKVNLESEENPLEVFSI